MTKKLTNLELLQELNYRLNQKEIGFWIENQECYLWENTFHYTNKIKVGDLSQTKRFINLKFSEISDGELIEELKNRVKYQPTIKLSMYSDQKHIFIAAKDIKCGTSIYLPIEIKPGSSDD